MSFDPNWKETCPLEELQDYAADLSEHIFEIETQHASECALYGDSWPGACIDIQNARESLKRLNEIIRRRFPEVFEPKPEPAADYSAADDDIPF